jgi:hypothetical protein
MFGFLGLVLGKRDLYRSRVLERLYPWVRHYDNPATVTMQS